MIQSQSSTNILTDNLPNTNDVKQSPLENPTNTPVFPDNGINAAAVTNIPHSTTAPNAIMTNRYNSKRARISVAILCFINLINYMDRYTLAGNYL